MTNSWRTFATIGLESILATFGSSSSAVALSRFEQQAPPPSKNSPAVQQLDDSIAKQRVLVNQVHESLIEVRDRGKLDASGLLPFPVNVYPDAKTVAEAYIAAQNDVSTAISLRGSPTMRKQV
jgi:hypothetical protein